MRRIARQDPRPRLVFESRSKRPQFTADGESDGGNSKNSTRQPHGRIFRPGDIIRESGIYEVVHDQSHRTAHEVVMISKDLFPTCDTCMDRVRFKLVRTAPYIFQDLDFDPPQQ